MGVNSYKTALQTAHVLRPDDRDQALQDNENHLGFVSDLQVYSRLNLTTHFSIFASYNFMWTGQITRPSDNIIYNARTLSTVVPPNVPLSERDVESDFGLKPQFSSAILQGVSVGGELRF
jgi:hypothetical protein